MMTISFFDTLISDYLQIQSHIPSKINNLYAARTDIKLWRADIIDKIKGVTFHHKHLLATT